MPSQAGEMPTQQPPDVGYFSDLSKEISQEPARYSNSGSSYQFQPSRQEKVMPGRKNHRKHKRSAKHQSESDDRLAHVQKVRQFSHTTPMFVLDKSVEADSCRKPLVQVPAPFTHEKDTSRWPPPHCEEIIQNLNMETILPHLVKNGLLTQTEYEHIYRDREMPTRQNSYFVLNVLPRKGESGFKMFLESLKATEKDHLGHQDLVKLLSK